MRYLILVFLLSTASCALFRSGGGNTPRDVSENGMKLRQNVATYAQKFVGTPYLYAGTSPRTGFDCSGFTSFVLKEFKVQVSPASSRQATEGRPVDLNNVMPGDLIFFAQTGNNISHVAMVVRRTKEGITCTHSTTSRGVITENISTSSYWKPRIRFARDVIGR
jgi:cell wall-associated NlpC family hydrolase